MPPRDAAGGGDVAVVGAGIGGLTAAVALSRAGLRAHLLERQAVLEPIGAGLHLFPNATTVLRELGVGPALEQRGTRVDVLERRTRTGELSDRVDVAATAREVGAPLVAVHRAAVQEVLLDAALAGRWGPAAVLSPGAAVASVEDGPERARVRLRDGTEHSAPVVVGADGIRSAVRAALHGAEPPRYAGYTCYRGVAPHDAAWFDPHVSVNHAAPGVRFGYSHVGGGLVYWKAAVDAPPGGGRGRDHHADVAALVADWAFPVPQIVAGTGPGAVTRHDIADRDPLPEWGRGRISLLGDAAHPMTPNLGQGACQAVEDGYWLGRLLGRHGVGPRALRAYEALRAPRTARIVRQARRTGETEQHREHHGDAPRDADVMTSREIYAVAL